MVKTRRRITLSPPFRLMLLLFWHGFSSTGGLQISCVILVYESRRRRQVHSMKLFSTSKSWFRREDHLCSDDFTSSGVWCYGTLYHSSCPLVLPR